jgi:hypothetical protein
MASRARVQANRLLSGLVPRAGSSFFGLFTRGENSHIASRRQDTGATTLLGFRRPFHLTTLRDIAQE